MADRVVLMREGRIEQAGTPDELYRRPHTELADRFVGHVNEAEGTIEAREGQRARVRLAAGGAGMLVDGIAEEVGRKVRLLLRAERAAVATAWPPDDGASVLAAAVLSSDYLGLLVRYTLDAGGLPRVVTHPAGGGPMLAPRREGGRARPSRRLDGVLTPGPAWAARRSMLRRHAERCPGRGAALGTRHDPAGAELCRAAILM